MKTELLPENILRCMSKSDSRNVKTAEERLVEQEIKGEGDLHGQVEGLLRIRGIYFLHPPFGKKVKRYYPVGHSDFTIFINGRVYFLELKTENGKLSDDQRDFLRWCQSNGFEFAVCINLPQVQNALNLWTLHPTNRLSCE